MAAVAIVAAISSMAMPVEGCLEFAADTGAGRHLVSPQSLERQGVSPQAFSQCQLRSHENLRFSTGGGNRNSSDAIGLRDAEGIFHEANHFVLGPRPFVRSVGLDVSNGMGFLWLPNQLPCYIKECAEFQFQTAESNLIRASRVEHSTSQILLELLISFQVFQVKSVMLRKTPMLVLLKALFRIRSQMTSVVSLQERLCQRSLNLRDLYVRENLPCLQSIACRASPNPHFVMFAIVPDCIQNASNPIEEQMKRVISLLPKRLVSRLLVIT